MEKEKVFKTLVDVAKVAIPLGIVIHGTVFAFSSGSRQKILERDGYKCVVCGKTGCLDAAHKNHNRDNPDYNNPKNGKTLCVEHHLDDHKQNAGRNGLSKRHNDWAIDKLKERLG